MPRYSLVWLEIAEQQYRALAPDLRAEVDRPLVGDRMSLGEHDVQVL
jgi:hypothetical protein